MLVIKGFLVINSNVLFHCLFFPPSLFFFFLPVIITNIPGRCSGTHPIGLGTKAGEKLLKACQAYLTCISQVLYKAKSSWAREDRGWPGGHRHPPRPKAKLQPGSGRGGRGASAAIAPMPARSKASAEPKPAGTDRSAPGFQ